MEFDLINMKDEQTVCREKTCRGCKELEECGDAIKFTRNILRSRARGDLTHEQHQKELESRFGIARKPSEVHWSIILGDRKQEFVELFGLSEGQRMAIIGKASQEWRESFTDIMERLNAKGWYLPHVENNRLMFKTTNEPDFIHED